MGPDANSASWAVTASDGPAVESGGPACWHRARNHGRIPNLAHRDPVSKERDPTASMPFHPTPADPVLVAKYLQSRDEPAFEGLVRRPRPWCWRCVGASLGNGHDAEDAGQAVFLTLAQKARSLQGRSTVAGWLYRVAWHGACALGRPSTCANGENGRFRRCPHDTCRTPRKNSRSKPCCTASWNRCPECACTDPSPP